MILRLAGAVLLSLVLLAGTAGAEPVAVRFPEGVTRAFPSLRSTTGERLAAGDLAQYVEGDRVVSRLTFRFHDGSLYDETVAFTQRGVFRLAAYHLVQRGPSFPEALDASFERESGRYEVRYREEPNAREEILRGALTLPPDVYNGMLLMALKNLAPQRRQTVQVVAFTPRPRLVKMQLIPAAQDAVEIGETALRATRYLIRPDLGLFASLLVADVPDITCWIVEGVAPAFVRFEGPLYFMGPIWRIEPY
jgi:hypothetical protein